MEIILFIGSNAKVGRSTCAYGLAHVINNNFSKSVTVIDINNQIKKFNIKTDDFKYLSLELCQLGIDKFQESLTKLLDYESQTSDIVLINFPDKLNYILDKIDWNRITKFIIITNATTNNVCNADAIVSQLMQYPENSKFLLINQYNLMSINNRSELSIFQIRNIIQMPIIGEIPYRISSSEVNINNIGKYIEKNELVFSFDGIAHRLVGNKGVNSAPDTQISEILDIIFDI